MPATPGSKIPELRVHRPTGQAVVRLVNPRGGRRDYYLGKFGSEESKQRYQHLLARWIAEGRELPSMRVPVAGEIPSTVRQLTEQFLEWARTYYRRPDGTRTGEVRNLERACALLNERHGDLAPQDFTPNRLREMRDGLVDRRFRVSKDKAGKAIEGSGKCLSRNYINNVARRIKQMFKWCESRELVSASCYHRLASVGSLKAGRTNAKETKGLSPVTKQQVDATVPHLSRQVAGLVWFCWHTGARMGEATQLATRFLDMRKSVWLFTPPQHKNSHRGQDRVIPIGKDAQKAIRLFMQVVPDRRWFRPCDTMAELNAERMPDLTDKSTATRIAKNARRRKANPKRVPGEEYATNAVQIAIRRACNLAGVAPWTPHMLRHAALTRIREERGLEAAAAIGGHWTLDVTQLYTRAAQQKLAVEVMREMG
jgi:integrase